MIPNKRCAFPGRRMGVSHRDAEKTPSPSSRACPGTYLKRPRYQNNPCWMFQRSRISLGAISGRRMGISASHFPGRRMGISLGRCRDDGWRYPTTMLRRHPPRHPGLAPGPIRSGTYLKRPRYQNNPCWMFLSSRISLGAISGRRMCGFLRSRISLGRFRDDGWGYPTAMVRRHPNRHPGLAPGPKKAKMQKQPLSRHPGLVPGSI